MIIKTYNPGKLLALLLFFVLLSCGKNILYTDSFTIPDNTWKLTEITEFRYESTDTVSRTNVSINIRTGTDFPYRNIFLFLTAISPDGKSITDTLEYELADEKGTWYGKGPGDIHELALPYRSDVFFPLTGTYTFRIQHGMRIRDLKGVYDIGLKIEKIKI